MRCQRYAKNKSAHWGGNALESVPSCRTVPAGRLVPQPQSGESASCTLAHDLSVPSEYGYETVTNLVGLFACDGEIIVAGVYPPLRKGKVLIYCGTLIERLVLTASTFTATMVLSLPAAAQWGSYVPPASAWVGADNPPPLGGWGSGYYGGRYYDQGAWVIPYNIPYYARPPTYYYPPSAYYAPQGYAPPRRYYYGYGR